MNIGIRKETEGMERNRKEKGENKKRRKKKETGIKQK